jgi:hypothetical protein
MLIGEILRHDFFFCIDGDLINSFIFIMQTIMSNYNGGISFLWSLSYWSTFLLTW